MRKELELSQPEFAARLGTNVQTVAAWEEEGGASRCRRQNDPRSNQCALQKVMGGSVNPKPHGESKGVSTPQFLISIKNPLKITISNFTHCGVKICISD